MIEEDNQAVTCETCFYPIEECICDEEQNDSEELFKENPLKAIWIKLKEIEEMLQGGEEGE